MHRVSAGETFCFIIRRIVCSRRDLNDFRKFPEWDTVPKALDNELMTAIRERDAARNYLKMKRKEKRTFDREMKEKWKDLDEKLNKLQEDELRHEQFSLVYCSLYKIVKII